MFESNNTEYGIVILNALLVLLHHTDTNDILQSLLSLSSSNPKQESYKQDKPHSNPTTDQYTSHETHANMANISSVPHTQNPPNIYDTYVSPLVIPPVDYRSMRSLAMRRWWMRMHQCCDFRIHLRMFGGVVGRSCC
mmetsp:Transcript_10301/g.17458  ORF Transcript_10301/g.17458 Transcript_10301/m.17458 type:complete len:137 (+) Transcript_10301:83-493(+)